MRSNRSIWDELQNMQKRMDSLFDEFFTQEPMHALPDNRGDGSGTQLAGQTHRQPMTNYHEDEKNVYLDIETPGVSKENLEVSVTEHGVEVQATQKHEVEDKGEKTYRYEKRFANFYRHYPLPEYVNAAKAECSYKDGVLHITVPKNATKTQAKKRLPIQ